MLAALYILIMYQRTMTGPLNPRLEAEGRMRDLSGRERLALARPDALLLELASAPYGFDLLLARKLGLRAELESGIPGRYCPRTAAKILWRYIEREVLRK